MSAKSSNNSWASNATLAKSFDEFEADWELVKKNGIQYKFESQPGDIFVAGPRKAATTQMQNLLHQLKFKGDPDFDNVWYRVPRFPDHYEIPLPDAKFYAPQTPPRLFKTHMNLPDTAAVADIDKTKIVVTTRNPRGLQKASQKFTYRFFGDDRDVPEEEMVALLDSPIGRKRYNMWNHIATWYSQMGKRDNMIFVTFEKIKAEPEKYYRKIADFLGFKLTDEEFTKVVEYCSHDWMQAHPEKFSTFPAASKDGTFVCKERTSTVLLPGYKPKPFGPETLAYFDRRWKEEVEPVLGFANYEEFLKSIP